MVSGGEITSFTGSDTTYYATFVPNGDGEKSITIKAGSFIDLEGRAVTPSSSISFIYTSHNVLIGDSNVYKLLKGSQEIILRSSRGGSFLIARHACGTSHKHLLLRRVLRCFLRRRTAGSRSIPGVEN